MTLDQERARDLLAAATNHGGVQSARLSDRDYRWLRRRGFVRGLYSMPADSSSPPGRYFTLTAEGEALFCVSQAAPSPTPARIAPKLKGL